MIFYDQLSLTNHEVYCELFDYVFTTNSPAHIVAANLRNPIVTNVYLNVKELVLIAIDYTIVRRFRMVRQIDKNQPPNYTNAQFEAAYERLK